MERAGKVTVAIASYYDASAADVLAVRPLCPEVPDQAQHGVRVRVRVRLLQKGVGAQAPASTLT